MFFSLRIRKQATFPRLVALGIKGRSLTTNFFDFYNVQTSTIIVFLSIADNSCFVQTIAPLPLGTLALSNTLNAPVSSVPGDAVFLMGRRINLFSAFNPFLEFCKFERERFFTVSAVNLTRGKRCHTQNRYPTGKGFPCEFHQTKWLRAGHPIAPRCRAVIYLHILMREKSSGA